MINGGGVEALVEGMKSHVNDADVQQQACRALVKLVDNDSSMSAVNNIIHNAGGVEAIISGMRKHLEVAEVQQHACDLLCQLAWNKQTIKEKIGSTGGMEAVVNSMRQHEDVLNVQIQACRALLNLAWSEGGNGREISDLGGVQLIIDAMNAYLDDADVQQFGIWSLRQLSHHDETISSKICDEGGIEAFVCGMKAHADERLVQYLACEALACFPLNCSAYRIKAESVDAVAALVGATTHWSSDEMAGWARQALQKLGYDIDVEMNQQPPQSNNQPSSQPTSLKRDEPVLIDNKNSHHRANNGEHQEASGPALCVICLDATANHALVPCGHLVICGESVCQEELHKCPICRKKVKKTLRIWTV